MVLTTERREIWTVSSFTEEIKNLLGQRFFSVAIKGEVSNIREQASGHIYFTLKDKDSQLSCVLFKGHASKLRQKPNAGDEIIAEGQVSVYPPRGSYQLVVHTLSYSGVGDLLLHLHRLKEELEQLGWFREEHKQSLPTFPKTVGVITSPTGAVIRDILHVLTRRMQYFHLILYPVRVQGKGAEKEIAQAINDMNRFALADILIVGRGGGSLEELWPFNERIVAQAIHMSRIPIVSAVGHETDYCIADLVADVRAPTPSAAAEIISQEHRSLVTAVEKLYHQITRFMFAKLEKERILFKKFATHPLLQSPYALIEIKLQKLDDATNTLTREMRYALDHRSNQLTSMERMWVAMLTIEYRHLQDKKNKLFKLYDHLQSVHPYEPLSKGYCISFRENSNSVILSSKSMVPGERVSLLFHDGRAKASIEEIDDEK